MSDTGVDDLLSDLAAELLIEPSAQMAARVRARVYGGSQSSLAIPSWTVGVAVTALMIAVALGIAPDRHAAQQPIVQSAARQVETSRRVVQRPVSPEAFDPAPDRARRSSARRPAIVRQTPVAEEPVAEVLVPPDQAIALRRVLLAMRSGRSPVPPAMAEAVDAEGRLPAPEAIGISAITIQPITPLPDGGRNKDR